MKPQQDSAPHTDPSTSWYPQKGTEVNSSGFHIILWNKIPGVRFLDVVFSGLRVTNQILSLTAFLFYFRKKKIKPHLFLQRYFLLNTNPVRDFILSLQSAVTWLESTFQSMQRRDGVRGWARRQSRTEPAIPWALPAAGSPQCPAEAPTQLSLTQGHRHQHQAPRPVRSRFRAHSTTTTSHRSISHRLPGAEPLPCRHCGAALREAPPAPRRAPPARGNFGQGWLGRCRCRDAAGAVPRLSPSSAELARSERTRGGRGAPLPPALPWRPGTSGSGRGGTRSPSGSWCRRRRAGTGRPRVPPGASERPGGSGCGSGCAAPHPGAPRRLRPAGPDPLRPARHRPARRTRSGPGPGRAEPPSPPAPGRWTGSAPLGESRARGALSRDE